MEKFIDKYRIASSRLESWDYGANAIYFITICTNHGKHYFGDIVENKMEMNEIGEMANQYWMNIPKHFPFVILGVHTIMPNHIHGVLIIDKSDSSSVFNNNNNKWKPGTLGVIINQYKRIVTINARKINPNFRWKDRFHDNIVRNDKALNTIQQYIKNNPLLWKQDKFYTSQHAENKKESTDYL